MIDDTALIPRQSLAQMVDAWDTATKEIRIALNLLETAKTRLTASFSASDYRFGFQVEWYSRHYGPDDADRMITEVKKDVWRTLIDRMELRKIMCLEDIDKLDKQLETGEGMPEITLPNLIAMIEGSMNNIPQMIERLVKEVYNWLRPYGMPSDWTYKTNDKNTFQLTSKVIKERIVEHATYNQHWKVNYHRQDNLRALDNVMHALDGKGLPKSHYGPLVDAICALPLTQNTGETDYFRFKCYKNSNLHLEIKRQDLIDKFNLVAGGHAIGDVLKKAA